MARIEKYTEKRIQWDARYDGPVEPGVMEVIERDGHPYMVNFKCPCGCGRDCPTRLVSPTLPRAGNSPIWDFSSGPNGPTLSPSVWWTSGCKAHFTITDGKVAWC